MNLAGLELPHPLGLAAGFDKDGEAQAGLLRLGFSWVEVGTVTPKAQAGNPRPRLFRLTPDQALINRMGFNNKGVAALVGKLERRDRTRGIVGVNLGINKDTKEPLADYVFGLERCYGLADYLTVNVSSPNTPGLRALQHGKALDDLLAGLMAVRAKLVRATGIVRPLFLKVAPDLTPEDEADIADLVVQHGVSGLIVANTTVARPTSLRSPAAGEAGGLSGRPLLVPSTRLLARFALRLQGKLPLIGVGGIGSGADAFAKIRAGATALQLYTALIYQGPALVDRILVELATLLERSRHASLAAAAGGDAEILARPEAWPDA